MFIWSNRNMDLFLLYLETIPCNSLTQADQSFKCSVQITLILFPQNLNSRLPSSIKGRPISASRKKTNLLFSDISSGTKRCPANHQGNCGSCLTDYWYNNYFSHQLSWIISTWMSNFGPVLCKASFWTNLYWADAISKWAKWAPGTWIIQPDIQTHKHG